VKALLLLLLAATPQQEADFRSANERALEGNLDGAIELYGTLLSAGIDDADVHYNLGNAYAQAGKPIEAVLSYERALRRSPGDAEILENLRSVRRKLANVTEDAPASTLTAADAIEPMIAALPLVWFAWIAIGANAMLFGAWFMRRRSSKRIFGVLTAVSAVALALALAVVAGHWTVARDPRGVLVNQVELREGPNAKNKSKGPALRGGRVRVIDQADDFLEVLQEDGTSGWVPAKAVTRV
jgi:tetratricopeptide (TPR) repeat protein